MIEQLNEEISELGDLKTELETRQETLFWNKVDSDGEYQKELRLLDGDQKDEVAGFVLEFADIFSGIKESVFIEANENNEELVVANIREELVWLEKEIANS